jgi:beta-phosphoglucomutase-like phosphatase (HAD superfamily)
VTDARAVIFDFDGVLADTEGLHFRAFQSALTVHGLTLDRAEYFSRLVGLNDLDMVEAVARAQQRSLSSQDLDAILSAKAQEYWRQMSAGSVLFDAAASAIARLGARYRLGIASGSFHDEIASILAANQLTSAIGVIVGADDVRRSKPNPEPYASAVSALGVSPARAVAVEDTPIGLNSARAAGLRTIGITTSHPAERLRPADAVIGHLDELTIDLVERLIGLAGIGVGSEPS